MSGPVTNRASDSLKILMAIVFYPRGGSAQVVRYLARALIDHGHQVRIVSGTLKGRGAESDAERFYGRLAPVEVDYTEADRGYRSGLNPMSERFAVPFPPSYEDKQGVPDRVFYKLDRREMEHQVRTWKGVLARVIDDFQPDISHLNHLNHLHVAAASLQSTRAIPRVSHLHGTELKMLEEMTALSDSDPCVRLWDENLRKAAGRMDHFITISPDNVDRAKDVLELEDDSISSIPNGVDTDLFKPQVLSPSNKMSFLEEILVNSPRGWDETGVEGSISYQRAALESFVDEAGELKPILMFVGRFLAFKRVPLLIEALARANRTFAAQGHERPPFNLLVWGGIPGEWEGEHPLTAARRLGVDNVFFTGWLPHDRLSKGMNLADVMVAPSYYEPFGQVFLEAMATAVPVIATRSGGPLSFVIGEGPEANGWFSEVDDADSLASVIVESISNESEWRRRGRNALELVEANYNWPSIARRFEQVYIRLLTQR